MSLSHKPAHPGSPAPRIIDFFAFCPNMEILNFVMKQGHQWKCCFRFLCSCLPCALDVLPESPRWDSGFFHLGMFPPEVSGEILPSWDMSEAKISFHLFPLVAREGDNAVPICLNSSQVQGRTFALKGEFHLRYLKPEWISHLVGPSWLLFSNLNGNLATSYKRIILSQYSPKGVLRTKHCNRRNVTIHHILDISTHEDMRNVLIIFSTWKVTFLMKSTRWEYAAWSRWSWFFLWSYKMLIINDSLPHGIQHKHPVVIYKP